MLAQAIKIRVIRQAGSETQVLRLKDDRGPSGIKQNLVRVATANGEGEGLLNVVELEVASLARTCGVGPGKDRFGDLKYLVSLVLDLDVNTII